MGYLGKLPATQGKDAGPTLKIDDISGDFNGSKTAFDLKIDGTGVSPHINNIQIYLSGVHQQPTTAFTLAGSSSGSQVRFTSAPSSEMSFHGALIGDARLMTPDNDTVEPASLTSGTATTISGSFTSVSSSIAADVASNLANRRTNTTISGSTTSLSSSVASDVAANLVSITNNSSSVASDVAANLVSITNNSSSFASRYTNQINQDLRTTASPTFVNTTVTGTLTAQEIHTEFESASILFTSGSTQFGNSLDDNHVFSGSLLITGSLIQLKGGSTKLRFSNDAGAERAFLQLNGTGLNIDTDSFIDFKPNNTFAARFDSNGRLGIGTNNPASNLVVSSSTKTDVLIGDNTSVFSDTGRGNVEINGHGSAVLGLTVDGAAKGLLLHDGTDSYFRNYANGQFQIYTNNTVRMTVSSSGEVGIGTASPSNNLHIHTDNSAEGILLKSTGNTRNNLIFDGNISSAADNIAFIDANWNGTNVARISMFTGTDTSNKDDGRIGFATAAAGTVAERMRIETDGRVAIKATSFPQDFGNDRGHLLISSVDDGGANNYAVLQLQGHSIANDVAVGSIAFYDHDNNTALIQTQRDDSTSKGNILFYTNGGSGVTERMQIQSDGVITTAGDFKPGADVIMASSRGISFTATSDATGMSSELLDDYEEGVYDITIGGLGGGSIGLDSSKQALSYTKIGRQVTVQGEISVTSVSSLSGTMTINLPFSVGSTIGDLSSRTIGSFSSQNHNYHDLALTIHSHTYEGQSVMYFVYHKDNAGWEYVNTNTLASNTEFRVSLTYFTN